MTRTSTDDPRIRVLALGRDVGACFDGAERMAMELVKRLDPERFRRYVCSTFVAPDSVQEANEREFAELEADGVGVLRLDRRSLSSNLAWGRLYEFMRRERIDVLHAHMPRASVPGTIIGRLARVPVIISHEHGWSFQGKPVRRFLDRNVVARWSDVLLAVSEYDRQHIIDVEGIAPDVVRILPNGIPPPPESGSDFRAELGVPAGVPLIGAVGRLYPEKGHDDLIRAVALLKRNGTPLRCVIAGSGPERERLLGLVSELGLTEELQLAGRREDVADVIRALDVAVLSSHNEGSPLAIIEYMAGGAPIAATAVGGVPELIEHEVHGLLTRPQEPADLAAAIGRLLRDRALATRLGRAARERQRVTYDLDAVVTRLERLYVELHASVGSRERSAPQPATPDSPNNGSVRFTTDRQS